MRKRRRSARWWKKRLLAPGTSPGQQSNERNTFVANGARSIQNSYLLDGVDNKNKIVGFDNSSAQSVEPVLDSVQEFKVQTSTFSAEFGQSAGAVVNVTTKAGTNQFHGSAFEFLRNSFLDASPYFQPAQTPKPQFIQNQFGATLGGRVIKDRTFFFFGWQSSREVNAAPQLAAVPTDARIGYQETRETQNISGERLFDQYGIIGAPDIATVLGLPTFAISGLSTIGTTGPERC